MEVPLSRPKIRMSQIVDGRCRIGGIAEDADQDKLPSSKISYTYIL